MITNRLKIFVNKWIVIKSKQNEKKHVYEMRKCYKARYIFITDCIYYA